MEIRQSQAKSLRLADVGALKQIDPGLVIVFGSVALLAEPGAFEFLSNQFPAAALAGCSTAGEITAKGVADDTCVITAIRFDSVHHKVVEARVSAMDLSQECGRRLGDALAAPDLSAVLVFGTGLGVNGSALIEGITAGVGKTVPVSGGLAGDGGAFKQTLTLTPSGISPDGVVAIGLYGDKLRIGHGSFGGWSPFGPARKVTRCAGNILYELDGIPALNVYRDYLGEYAKDLPASGLLFPFAMLDSDHGSIGLIRTILAIDDAAGSLVLAGDVDPDGYLRLMHASTDNLVDGAEVAAGHSLAAIGDAVKGGFGLLVSCVGRKLVMGDAVEEEVEVVSAKLGRDIVLAGFYSYGEIAPFSSATDCKLHNQTMTVTFINED